MSRRHKIIQKKIGFDRYIRKRRLHKKLLVQSIGLKCNYCFKKFKYNQLTVDHIVPLAEGGSDELTNKILCCRPCNALKGSMSIDEWAKHLGWELDG